MASIFDNIISLPLFKGASRELMSRTVGKYRFEFKKFDPGEIIVERGTPCQSVIFVFSGEVRSSFLMPNGITISQIVPENTGLSHEYLFGLATFYPATVEAAGQVSVLEISKRDFLSIIDSDPVFKFNYLNMVCRKAQKCLENAIFIASSTIAHRVAALLDLITHAQSKDNEISVAEDAPFDLPYLFGVSEHEYNSTLGPLADDGALTFNNRCIKIADRNALIEILKR